MAKLGDDEPGGILVLFGLWVGVGNPYTVSKAEDGRIGGGWHGPDMCNVGDCRLEL
jgi:hypothetical protein